MATDMFLKLGDLKGEAQDDRHRDEIEIDHWSWSMSQSGSVTRGGGAGAGKANFADFAFTHKVDKASPNLMKMCATGEHVREAVFTARKAGKGQQEYLTIRLSDLMVTRVELGGASGDAGAMAETFTVQAAKWDLEYRPQKGDGSLDAGVHFKYDQKANKEG